MTRLLLCAALGITLCSPVHATNFWLSPSNSASAPPATPGDVPTINHSLLGGNLTSSIYVWGRPDAGKTLANWSLRLRSENSNILTLDDVAIEDWNPVLGNTGPPDNEDIVRWESVGEPTGNASSINDFGGFTVFNVLRTGIGIGPGTTGTDPYYDSTNDAWLLAEVNYSFASLGQTELYLQIGDFGLNNQGESSSMTGAVLGSLSDTALSGDTGRRQDSATPDAVINVTLTVANANFDGDNDIDGKDFLTWQTGFGLPTPTFAQGDADMNGMIDAADRMTWEQQFGGPPPVTAFQFVPEPGALVLWLALACTPLLRRTR